MINLWEFYKNNKEEKINQDFIKQEEKNKIDAKRYYLYNDNESIMERFKAIIMPEISEKYNKEIEIEYLLICYYLSSNHYIINEFPNSLTHPNYDNFTNNEIKIKAAQKYGLKEDGATAWKHRKMFILNDLQITKYKNHIPEGEDINKLITSIVAGNKSFNELEKDEKLREIRNAYEHLIHKMGGFKNIDYSVIFLGYINEENLTNFFKKLHIFRHGNEKSVNERKSISESEKDYMIDLGLTVIKALCRINKKD